MLQGAERKLEKTVTTPGETKGETPKRNKGKRRKDRRKVGQCKFECQGVRCPSAYTDPKHSAKTALTC